ncbi:unnamed protein product [Allacma fusca]|uniref:Uncharacterized protein n=1 Tax=Allacma fusca TaxID=39272 RepID=A0A8J2L1X7_9HEXA|nr:unnamed protein product [Allacma fusca]
MEDEEEDMIVPTSNPVPMYTEVVVGGGGNHPGGGSIKASTGFLYTSPPCFHHYSPSVTPEGCPVKKKVTPEPLLQVFVHVTEQLIAFPVEGESYGKREEVGSTNCPLHAPNVVYTTGNGRENIIDKTDMAAQS